MNGTWTGWGIWRVGGKYWDSLFRHSPLCPIPGGDFYLDQGPCVAVAFPSAPHPGGTYSSPSCQVPNWICHLTSPSYGEGKSSDAWARPPISLRGRACLFLSMPFCCQMGFPSFLCLSWEQVFLPLTKKEKGNCFSLFPLRAPKQTSFLSLICFLLWECSAIGTQLPGS